MTADFRSGLLPLLLAAALPAAAQDITRIGGEEKRTVGTVMDLANGDIACHLSLQDDRGKAFDESADFELCSRKPSLLGKRVRLAYRMANVQSAQCQGDPDCRKSDRIALVVDAQVLPPLPREGAKPAVTATPAQATFCTGREIAVFSCRVGAKLVSVCASKDATRVAGHAQYRFGKPDSREPLELTVPAGLVPAAKVATGESVPFAGGGGAWMRFRNGAHAYVVYTGIGKWGPKGETRTKEGLVVEKDGRRIAHFKCNGPVAGELGPDWFDRVGVQAKGEDFDFPD